MASRGRGSAGSSRLTMGSARCADSARGNSAVTGEGRLVRQVTARRRAEIATIVAAMPQEGRHEVVAALNAFAQAAGEATPSVDTAARLGW